MLSKFKFGTICILFSIMSSESAIPKKNHELSVREKLEHCLKYAIVQHYQGYDLIMLILFYCMGSHGGGKHKILMERLIAEKHSWFKKIYCLILNIATNSRAGLDCGFKSTQEYTKDTANEIQQGFNAHSEVMFYIDAKNFFWHKLSIRWQDVVTNHYLKLFEQKSGYLEEVNTAFATYLCAPLPSVKLMKADIYKRDEYLNSHDRKSNEEDSKDRGDDWPSSDRYHGYSTEVTGMRQCKEDPEWTEVLCRFRNGEITKEDIDKINEHTAKSTKRLFDNRF